MRAADILEVSRLRFIEPSFADLPDSEWNEALLQAPAEEGRLLIDRHEEPLGLAFREGEDWTAGSFHLRPPSAALVARFEETGGDIYQDEKDAWAAAVREYYSIALAREITPALDDLNPDRIGMIEELVEGFWGTPGGITCLDCCCGSGLGSLVLRRRGIHPLSYDNDPALLSLGLARGRLLPEETMWIDATVASRYTGNVTAGIGLMFGVINSFNAGMWERITAELISLTDYCLITVGTRDEADLVSRFATSRGREVEVLENPRDPIYDRFVCDIRSP